MKTLITAVLASAFSLGAMAAAHTEKGASAPMGKSAAMPMAKSSDMSDKPAATKHVAKKHAAKKHMKKASAPA